MSSRPVPLVVIGSASSALADRVALDLRGEGNVVYITHSADGCLRVAVSVEPDVIMLDSSFPGRVEKLLKAHPSSAHAQIVHLPADASRLANRATPKVVAA